MLIFFLMLVLLVLLILTGLDFFLPMRCGRSVFRLSFVEVLWLSLEMTMMMCVLPFEK